VAHIRLVEEADADGLLAEEYDAAIERAGKVFNILKAMSLRPEVLRASIALDREIVLGESSSRGGSASSSQPSPRPSRAATTERGHTPTTSVQRAQTRSWRRTGSTTGVVPTSRRVSGRSASSPSS
jgi:hypothetical protein